MKSIFQKIVTKRNFMVFVFLTFVASVIFSAYKMALAPATLPEGVHGIRVKADYILMLLESIVGIFAMLLPNILIKKIKLSIPSFMVVAYALFLYSAIFLGEVQNYYYKVQSWDSILHIFSGAMLGAIGFSFVTILNNSEKVLLKLSPIFVAIFAFCFAVTLGVVWEIYEFSVDLFFGTNMQKFALEDGTQLVGNEALSDTMKDLIVDSIGALTMSIVGYISLKTKNGLIEKLRIKKSTH